MTRNEDQSPSTPSDSLPSARPLSPLQRLGWQPFFSQQISADEMTQTPPVRVAAIHRNGLHVLGDDIDTTLPPEAEAIVGDWLLYDPVHPGRSQILERKSLFKRRAPGTDRDVQLIAANVDTAFIVSSCNEDFNVPRLERYIAMTFEAGATPVIVLTKPDLCEDPQKFIDQAASVSDLVSVVALDARREEPGEKLREWCRPGQTLAFLGSSGVGKSTLTNALSGSDSIKTQGIREDDAKGRHTTRHRQLHIMPEGYTIVDTPGMRELQLTDAASGVEQVFSDLNELAGQCRFRNCRHETEPGCAILMALETGVVDPLRLARWQKLVAEDQFNSLSLAERKSKDKALGKLIRDVNKRNRK